MTAALFDLDRTLVEKDTAGLFIRYEYQNGLTSATRVALVAWWRLLYTFGLVDAERVARRVLGWYRGRNETELRAHTLRWFQAVVVPLISIEGRRIVSEHRARGDLLVVVTASTKYVAELVAAELGIEHIVCTELEVQDGVLTGGLVDPLCFGRGKLQRARRFLDEVGASLSEAVLYTDSITDLPLLEAVREPVAVNPDPRLSSVALARGWGIQSW